MNYPYGANHGIVTRGYGYSRSRARSPEVLAAIRWRAHDDAVAAARARPRPETPPVIVCQPVHDRLGRVVQWRWRCEYCRTWHGHAPSPGMRASHCVEPSSPFFELEYILALAD